VREPPTCARSPFVLHERGRQLGGEEEGAVEIDDVVVVLVPPGAQFDMIGEDDE
jgi:hypothetical protein